MLSAERETPRDFAFASINATTPATAGEDMLVPDNVLRRTRVLE